MGDLKQNESTQGLPDAKMSMDGRERSGLIRKLLLLLLLEMQESSRRSVGPTGRGPGRPTGAIAAIILDVAIVTAPTPVVMTTIGRPAPGIVS